MPPVEWAPTIISAIAAAVSVLGAWRATAADRRRQDSRRELGRVIDDGQRLVAQLRAKFLSPEGVASELDRWENSAHAAVTRADVAQLGRYHAEIPGLPSNAELVTERLRRLQEILDRL